MKLRLNRLGLNTTRVSSVSSHDYLRGLQCDGGCITLGLRAGQERQRHRAHLSQTKMRGGGGGEGITHRTRTRLLLFFFVTGHHEMCPTRNLTTRWRVARTFVTRKDRKSLVITEMIIH